MTQYGHDNKLLSDTAQLVQSGAGREHGSLAPISRLPSGLAREVWLYRYAKQAGEIPVVLAFGSDSAVVEANLSFLRQVSQPTAALFAQPLALVTDQHSARYIEVTEYLPGETLSTLLKRQAPVPEEALRAALDAMQQLHRAIFADCRTTRDGETLWWQYHRPRLVRRLDALEEVWPAFVRTVRSSGFELTTRAGAIQVAGVAMALSALDAIATELSPRRASLIHGDCKPENIIVERGRGARMIDAQLRFGDPLSDYAKLYYCVLTDGLLSQTQLPTASRLEVAHADCTVSIEFPVHPVNAALATRILEALSPLVLSESGAARRLHLCMGHVLIWQAGRLLEVALERQRASSSRERGSPTSDAMLSRTAHIQMWLVLGAFHLSCAANATRCAGLDTVADAIRSVTHV